MKRMRLLTKILLLLLVLSGATTGAELADSPHRPDYVIDGIAALLPTEPGEPASGPAARPRGSSR